MQVSNRIQQTYGYLVCLIAIVTLLFSTGALINAIFDLTKPVGIERFGPDQGFAEYRLTQLERATTIREKTGGTFAIPDDSTLKRQYDDQIKSRAAFDRWNGIKSIVTSIIMIILAIILFSIHWRWLRGLARSEPSDA